MFSLEGAFHHLTQFSNKCKENRSTVGSTAYLSALKRNTMPEVNFYLKEPQGWNPKTGTPKNKRTDKESLVLLQMKYGGQRFVYSTGEFIKPSHWRFDRQRLKNVSG